MRSHSSHVISCCLQVSSIACASLILSDSTSASVQLHETTKLTSQGSDSVLNFGFDVAIHGEILIAGETDDESGFGYPAAYVYDVNTGNELVKLTRPRKPILDLFGFAVDINGDTAVIGAPGDDSIYIYNFTTGSEVAEINFPFQLGGLTVSFGHAVAINENIALASMSLYDWPDSGSAVGSAIIFDTKTGDQLGQIVSPDSSGGDRFGQALALSGNTAIIGAWGKDVVGDDSGVAYLYDVNSGYQIAELSASDAAPGDRFGRSVAISGGIAIIGAPSDAEADGDPGSAYLFDAATGEQIAKLTASDATAGDGFGRSVGIHGNLAIVGAVNYNLKGSESGSAYLFDVTTGIQIAKLTASDAAPGDLFGWSVDVNDDTAIVGAWGNNYGTGAVYLFNIPEPSSAVILILGTQTLTKLKSR